MTDAEKTKEITRRIDIMNNGTVADNFLKIKEYRLGTGYDGFSQRRCDVFAISPNAGNKTICYEVKVSRADFKNDIKKQDKQIAARCFANEFYYCTPVGLLKEEEIPAWAGLIEFDLSQPIDTTSTYYPDVRATFVKRSPHFDKCLPTWGMVAAAYRNGIATAQRYREASIECTNVSVDMSTNENDAQNRIFARIIERQGNTLLCNFVGANYNVRGD